MKLLNGQSKVASINNLAPSETGRSGWDDQESTGAGRRVKIFAVMQDLPRYLIANIDAAAHDLGAALVFAGAALFWAAK